MRGALGSQFTSHLAQAAFAVACYTMRSTVRLGRSPRFVPCREGT
jgi:hypothetical protein